MAKPSFATTGQSCIAANRIYVQAGIYDTALWITGISLVAKVRVTP